MSGQVLAAELPDHCLSVPGCQQPRLRYAGYCRGHSPSPDYVEHAARCQAPLRCYCPQHRLLRGEQGPTITADAIRLMLATKRGTR